MNLIKYKIIILLIFIVTNIVVFAQAPKREIVSPDDRYYFFKNYRNDSSLNLGENGIPIEFVSYFDYNDFVDFEPIGQLFVDPQYHNKKNINSIPKDMIHIYYKRSADTFRVKYLSELLYKLKEPVLSNSYMGIETYRFIWTPSFHDYYIIRLKRLEESSELIIKKYNTHTGKIEQSSKVITGKEFEEFKQLLVNSNYWIMKSYEWTMGNDGATWTIEAHVSNGYKVLCRWAPGLFYEDDLILRQLGTWLIEKSEIDVTEIY